MDKSIIISHIKDSVISFVDLNNNTVSTSELDYQITAMQKIDENTIIFSSQNEDGLFNLNLLNGKIDKVVKTSMEFNNLLYNEAENLLFFSDSETDQIGYMDGTSNKIQTRVSVGDGPTSMVYNSNKHQLYVMNTEAASISVVDVNNNEEVLQFPIVERPNGIFYDGENVWIGGHGAYGSLNDQVYIYDPETGEQIDRIEVGLMPVGFYGDQYDQYVYVVCHGENMVYQVDIQTRAVIQAMEVAANPYHITGNRQNIYVTSIDGNALSVIDRSNFQLSEQLQLAEGPYMMILGEEHD